MLMKEYDKVYDEYDKYSEFDKTGLTEEHPKIIKLREYQKELDDMNELEDKLEDSYREHRIKLFELVGATEPPFNFIDKPEIKNLWNLALDLVWYAKS